MNTYRHYRLDRQVKYIKALVAVAITIVDNEECRSLFMMMVMICTQVLIGGNNLVKESTISYHHFSFINCNQG